MNRGPWKDCAIVLALVGLTASGLSTADADEVRANAKPALAAPPGFGVQLTREGLVWATPDGMSIYTHIFDVPATGEIRCDHGCPDAFAPVMAAAGTKPVGDFKLHEREGGKLQWAYQGWPLWRFVDDTKPGESFGHGDFAEWNLLYYQLPAPKIIAPPGVTLHLGRSGNYILKDSQARTLYVPEHKITCDAACQRDLPILAAPILAHSIGAWSARSTPDGSSQWFYEGKPVHASTFDKATGESRGEQDVGGWVAIEIRSPAAELRSRLERVASH